LKQKILKDEQNILFIHVVWNIKVLSIQMCLLDKAKMLNFEGTSIGDVKDPP